MNAPAYNESATVQVAVAHIQAQGVPVTAECLAALRVLLCPGQQPDSEALERLVILASELSQGALIVAQSGTPQTVKYAPVMAEVAQKTWPDLCDLLGVEHA
ncbi:MAG TPA: hypothetical protein PLR37_10525 [Candidatus Accumulibacter phosphatis]|nr:hypothetical protein [Candidatus Accumulibacter phosphatis]